MDLHHIIAWGLFLAVVMVLLAVDLFVLHRRPHAIDLKEALVGALLPVAAAILFSGALWYGYQTHFLDLGILSPGRQASHLARFHPTNGTQAVIQFATGYLVELSLSADNVFLFVILMSFFKVPRELQHRVLFWGVLGALIMRGIMILMGAALLVRFQWIVYLFGAFLIYAGLKMIFAAEPRDPSDNLAVRLLRKLLPVHEGYDGARFFTRIDGKRLATTLFVVLVCIEFTDLVFALDSIPAIFGITLDPYIVFTSNVFAILGLRSMYFLLAGVMDRFYLLKYGLAVVLGFVGVKMLLPGLEEIYLHFSGAPEGEPWDVNQYVSMAIIVGTLTVSIVASLIFPSRRRHGPPPIAQPATPPRPPPGHPPGVQIRG